MEIPKPTLNAKISECGVGVLPDDDILRERPISGDVKPVRDRRFGGRDDRRRGAELNRLRAAVGRAQKKGAVGRRERAQDGQADATRVCAAVDCRV
jgi:hypothetical protein